MKNNHDPFDTFLAFERLAHDRNENPKIADYPEQVVNTLRKFLSLWSLPDAIIPDRKRASHYARWVKELMTLNDIGGSRILDALELSHLKYKKGNAFFVTSPAAIKNLLITTITEMNENKLSLAKESSPEVEDSAEKPITNQRTARNLLNILKD